MRLDNAREAIVVQKRFELPAPVDEAQSGALTSSCFLLHHTCKTGTHPWYHQTIPWVYQTKATMSNSKLERTYLSLIERLLEALSLRLVRWVPQGTTPNN